MTSECLPGYAPEFPVKQPHLFCDEEGEWTGLLHRCVPGKWENLLHFSFSPNSNFFLTVCGHAMLKNSNTSIDVKSGYEEEFPWHVAIYDKTKDHELVCSGSIITENTIMTGNYNFDFFSNFSSTNSWLLCSCPLFL